MLCELRFFRSGHREYFFSQLEEHFTRFPDWEMGIRRENLSVYRPYDADDDNQRIWGTRNIHQELVSMVQQSQNSEGSSLSSDWINGGGIIIHGVMWDYRRTVIPDSFPLERIYDTSGIQLEFI
jgi:hypothetical protein